MNLTQLPRWLRDHYLATGLLMFSGLGQSLFAATIIVNSLEDTTLADGQCTLREALDNANQDTAGVGDCLAGSGDDVIDLVGLNGTITLSAQLKITSNLILKGPGAEKLTLSGNFQTNVFYIDSGATVKINGVKIIEGKAISYCYENGIAGGIHNLGTLTLTNSQVSQTYEGYYECTIDIDNGDILALNKVILGNNSDIIRIMVVGNEQFSIYNEGTLTVNGSTVSENDDRGIGNLHGTVTITNSKILKNKGTGIENIYGSTLILTNSTVKNNGGGIINDGTLTITDSTVSENSAGDPAGGINNDGGTLTIINSTVSENIVKSNYNPGSGGIYNNGGTLTLINSTVSRNVVEDNSDEPRSGGIYNDGGTLTLTNSTISENVSVQDEGGGILNRGILNLQNTLIANNTNGDCDDWGTIDTNLNNFIGDGSCNPTFSGDPKLGPLANNGGPTFTHALLRGSPAIDVGDDTICAAEPVNGLDQRGVARFGSSAGNHCDIGAYEYQKPALATLGSFTIESDAIRWETLAEYGTQGFYIWQAEPVVAGTCEAVTNPQLVISKPIPAKGSEIQGEVYHAAVAVNLNGCYGIQEIPSGQIYITPRPGRNEWTGEQWLTR
ncbi:MAG: CSLREA domain-containing protein [Thioploca sp.]|nr:CSLREA domain-containing protein [Thioploca sp.]